MLTRSQHSPHSSARQIPRTNTGPEGQTQTGGTCMGVT